ncbi:DUF1810 domain-containing protein [Falsiroseomonas oryziterrae]|uniref:DUF1810 domain-containing protein n=1 Tax=Falsiroseomonas oryziterrae TaxID=2911368 RepID=UPI001F40DD25|nr:DUF1810 domain-containing protein [Roseomonas sp. NPKOSM-4]
MPDSFDLDRFLRAQEPLIGQVRAELAAGRKRSHWMWFVFPQLRGLGRSEMAHYYGISGLPEARAYASHPVLGPRLAECTRLVLGVEGRTAREILGSPDDLKFRSCMTLFARAAPEQPAFREALDRFFGGEPDAATLTLLEAAP